MSQQVNLILPELRPRFDWLGLPLVLSVALIGILGVVFAAALANQRLDKLVVQDAQLKASLQSVQQQAKEMGVALGARTGDASLPGQIQLMRLAVEQRQEVMKVLALGVATDEPGFAEVMRGFSRQIYEGVWLTAFSLGGNNIEIRGRLTEPSVLPNYIKRLNAEPAFAGRRFEALEMKGELPQAEIVPASGGEMRENRPTRPFTEFSLRSDALQKMAKEPAQ